jgi:hypothetical protein
MPQVGQRNQQNGPDAHLDAEGQQLSTRDVIADTPPQ